MKREAQQQLLQRFEPILRFTRGEQFFPMRVEDYVAACSLWVQPPGTTPTCLVPQGQLTLEQLSDPAGESADGRLFLKFIEPLTAAELALYTLHKHPPKEESFRAGRGRLARVGYVSRFVDALFSITLLARGRVPGDRAAAASIAYQSIHKHHPCHSYYGRVHQENGWIVLQYWFFYAFNNWRSGFFGGNDHEGDWEMICVYLAQSANGDLRPEWVAYAAHDYAGDDLRRRWDDPEVAKVGEHPVINVAAGSHAGYFACGEYLTELQVRFLLPLARITDRLQAFWHKQLRQYRAEPATNGAQRASNIFRIPFVDYARGDGLSIGPGQPHPWTDPVLLEPAPPWVAHYRGLWGLYTQDPFAGEDAPAGPMYNRDGTVRRSWYDPVGWAGLDKVAPSSQALPLVQQQQAELAQRQSELQEQITLKHRELQALGLEVAALQGQRHLHKLFHRQRAYLTQQSRELGQLRAQAAADSALLEALGRYGASLHAGECGPARAHLQRPRQPTPPTELRFSRVAETWAALSVSVMLLGFVGLVLFARDYVLFGLVASITLFVVLEAGFRGSLIRFVTRTTICLAIAAALIIMYEFFWQLIIFGVIVAGAYILWDNLRELWT